MEQMIRRLTALVSAIALVAGLAAVARSTMPSDDHISEICVIGGDIVRCVPHDA